MKRVKVRYSQGITAKVSVPNISVNTDSQELNIGISAPGVTAKETSEPLAISSDFESTPLSYSNDFFLWCKGADGDSARCSEVLAKLVSKTAVQDTARSSEVISLMITKNNLDTARTSEIISLGYTKVLDDSARVSEVVQVVFDAIRGFTDSVRTNEKLDILVSNYFASDYTRIDYSGVLTKIGFQ